MRHESLHPFGRLDAGQETESGFAGTEDLLESLSSDRLAGRIIEAARLAAAKEMQVRAHAIQFPVEAENSTYHHVGAGGAPDR